MNLKELQALQKAATSGPWRKLKRHPKDKPEKWTISGGMVMGKLIAVSPKHQGNDLSPRQHQANADLILAIHDAVAMLEAVGAEAKDAGCNSSTGAPCGDCGVCRILAILGGSYD